MQFSISASGKLDVHSGILNHMPLITICELTLLQVKYTSVGEAETSPAMQTTNAGFGGLQEATLHATLNMLLRTLNLSFAKAL